MTTSVELGEIATMYGFENLTFEERIQETKTVDGCQLEVLSLIWTANWRGQTYGGRVDVTPGDTAERERSLGHLRIQCRRTMEALIEQSKC